MLPQVDWAVNHKSKFAVLIMNPNEEEDEKGEQIPFQQDMADHACFIWKNYIENSGFKNIRIIAHSAGGDCLANI